MKTNLRKEKGITLIALVITIIVLLILGGVTIATVTGYDGILPNAKKATEQYTEGENKDQVIINEISDLFKQYSAYARFLEDYEELEYIESTGLQYIDTLRKPLETDKYEIFLKRIASSFVFGNNGGNGWSLALDSSIVIWRSVDINYQNSLPKDSNFHIYKMQKDNLTIDNVEYQSTFETGYKINSKENIYLFGTPHAENSKVINFFYGKCAIKYYICKNENNELIQNFIPCCRKSDGEVGMYDLIEEKFYGNSGTGDFVPGPLVNRAE